MLLKKLTESFGASGDEGEVRKIIKEELNDVVDEYRVDIMGNVFATKKSKNKNAPHVIICAHMDEVGLMVKGIDSDGYIKFASIGGIDPRVLVSKAIYIGKDKISGIIGSKAIHLQTADESSKAIPMDKLYIDIGCTNKKETEKLVSLGDYIYFDSKYVEFGSNSIKAKALDDRVGCAIIIELLKLELPITVTGVFTVQEEVGLRGAAVAANQVDSDLAIILEGTLCADIYDEDPHLEVTNFGAGPAISIMDRTSIYNRTLVDSLVDTAKENNIPWQYRRSGSGGNDAGRFHVAKSGTPSLSVAVPCRYIHSAVSVMNRDDFINTKKLILKYIEKIGEGGIPND
ncbi:MAG: M42 family metallopeptidase [Clostridiales bacterium]|nr:M42 family metallopeptidase [Clostridiales bacterium]